MDVLRRRTLTVRKVLEMEGRCMTFGEGSEVSVRRVVTEYVGTSNSLIVLGELADLFCRHLEVCLDY